MKKALLFMFLVALVLLTVGAETCTSGCTEGDLACSGDKEKVVECSADGIWVTTQNCAAVGYECINNKCTVKSLEPLVTECNSGEFGCDGNKVLECKSGKWVVIQTCAGDEICGFGQCTSSGLGGGEPAPTID